MVDVLGDLGGDDDDLVDGLVHLLPAERFTPTLGLGRPIQAINDDRAQAR